MYVPLNLQVGWECGWLPMLSFLCLQFRSTEMQFYCVAVIVLFGSCQCLHEVVHFDCILAIILFQSGKNRDLKLVWWFCTLTNKEKLEKRKCRALIYYSFFKIVIYIDYNRVHAH